MALDYKPLNRLQQFTLDQKKALRKLFGLAWTASDPSTPATISRTVIQKACSGHFSANERRDIDALFKELRSAIDADDNARDLESVFGAFCMDGYKRRALKTMADAVVANIAA